MALWKDNSYSKCQLRQTLLFFLFDLQAADEGDYQCVAESEAGKAERTITLRVQSEFCTYIYTHRYEIIIFLSAIFITYITVFLLF